MVAQFQPADCGSQMMTVRWFQPFHGLSLPRVCGETKQSGCEARFVADSRLSPTLSAAQRRTFPFLVTTLDVTVGSHMRRWTQKLVVVLATASLGAHPASATPYRIDDMDAGGRCPSLHQPARQRAAMLWRHATLLTGRHDFVSCAM